MSIWQTGGVRLIASIILVFLGCVCIYAQPPASWSYSDYPIREFDCIIGSARTLAASDTILSGPHVGKVCDTWDNDRYERPTSSDGTVFYADVDIIEIGIGTDNIWFYYFMRFYGAPSGNLAQQYGYEIDFDKDNRGDYFLYCTDGATPDVQAGWAIKNLSMYRDTTRDVGADTPLVAEGAFPTMDGYEYEVWKDGQMVGNEPAWVRINPDSNNVFEIAIKKSFVGNPANAGHLRGWASKGAQSAANYYLHDKYTNSSAGDAYPGETHYLHCHIKLLSNSWRNRHSG